VKLLHVLKKLDDLAEVLVYDVLLATPRRRRVAAVLTGTVAMGLYLASGFLVAPAPVEPAHLGVPIVPLAGLEIADEDLIARAVNGRRVNQRFVDRMRPLLESNSVELERVSVRQPPELLAQWCRVVGTRRATDVGLLLLARGLVLRHQGAIMAAQSSWLAALRVGAALTVGHGRDEDVGSHVLGGVLQTKAVRLLCQETRAGRFYAMMAREAALDLVTRPSLAAGLAGQLARYHERARGIVETWVSTNALPRNLESLRYYLPIREGARREAARAIRFHLDQLFGEQISAWQHGRPPPMRHELPGTVDRALTLVSSEATAQVAATLIFVRTMPNLDSYGRTCVDRDVEMGVFQAHCLKAAFGSYGPLVH
jgi:hypothetical protein